MSAVWATFLRELRAYFFSPLAYVVLFFLLVANGVIFVIIVSYLNDPLAPAGRPFDFFFNNFVFWAMQLFGAPVLTMRLLAEERRSGSIEVLMTAPVTEGQVVAGKYLAAFAFYLCLWLPTAAYAVVVDRFGDVDWGTIAAGYLGMALVGALFLSIGVLGSALSKNQIVAAIITFALNLLVFMVVWFTFAYVPMAHIVWGGGLLGADGALDFAGGTVVHINAGVAGLVGAYVLGKRVGYGKEALTPHSLTLTMVGASLLWVGWFGFNAGSAGAANALAGLAFVNTVLATAAAALSWIAGEALTKGKGSMLGAASGAVAGLVAVTPAAGFVGPMGSIVLGLLAGLICLWGVNGLKRMLGADDAFDVFGVHGVGGILGALLTGVLASQSLGGTGGLTPDTFAMGSQLWVQFKSVLLTVVWSGVVAFIAYKIADMAIGLRVTEEEEREGLDISSHGEAAYSK